MQQAVFVFHRTLLENETMRSYIESLTTVLLAVLVVVAITLVINRGLDTNVRKQANGVNGWQLGILGTIYAVVLGFMLSDAWLAYQNAANDVRNEAAALLAIYRTADLLPPDCAVVVRTNTRQYIDAVIDTEWPSMQEKRANLRGGDAIGRMWSSISQCDAHGTAFARDSVVRALETLQMRRNARVEAYYGHLPFMLWSVLLFGASVVIAASALLANERQSIHLFHVISLTVLIVVTLLAIADLDRPFDGITRVDADSIRAVQCEITSGQCLYQMPR